ncbi:MAG: NAD-dependent aldehyde dehydrogenase [uncultured archaeon A07HR60]|nr:MAG: NAD-dependent aldehyde dehydrogenase [uncultured archaeon A07HR60]
MGPTDFNNELTYQSFENNGDLGVFHSRYEEAVESVRADFGAFHPHRIGGETVETDGRFAVNSPGNVKLRIGDFARADETCIDTAVETAAATQQMWEDQEPSARARIFTRAARLLRERKFEFAATLSLENGKNRTEAMADVDEAIDFLEFYSHELMGSNGFRFDTGEPTPGQHTSNLLRPYGVFAVIAPFNFPIAILVGMSAGALLAGNTVVLKPAMETPLVAHKYLDVLEEAGIPDGVVNLVTGDGHAAGQPLVEHETVAGVVFTGSRTVGLEIQQTFLELGKRGPVIAELGGKNPVIVGDTATIEGAVEGVTRAAFSFGGQKCSATSRVYVHEAVYEDFTDRLVSNTEQLAIGHPTSRDTFVSPLISTAAVDRYEEITQQAQIEGHIRTGGSVVTDTDLPEGRYVEPTVVTNIPHDHELARHEHFVPFVTVHPVSTFEEGLRKSNDTDYGLCAGLFSEDESEIDRWFDEIQAGMCYVNRRRSATTGALVQAQPFGGWKFSGTTGKFAGGYHYLQQFMREQSRTRVR